VDIPADLDAGVHSQTAVGEQFVALRPRSGTVPLLKDGTIIPVGPFRVPRTFNSLRTPPTGVSRPSRHDKPQDRQDEGYPAVGGLGPELSRLGKGTDVAGHRRRAQTWTPLSPDRSVPTSAGLPAATSDSIGLGGPT